MDPFCVNNGGGRVGGGKTIKMNQTEEETELSIANILHNPNDKSNNDDASSSSSSDDSENDSSCSESILKETSPPPTKKKKKSPTVSKKKEMNNSGKINKKMGTKKSTKKPAKKMTAIKSGRVSKKATVQKKSKLSSQNGRTTSNKKKGANGRAASAAGVAKKIAVKKNTILSEGIELNDNGSLCLNLEMNNLGHMCTVKRVRLNKNQTYLAKLENFQTIFIKDYAPTGSVDYVSQLVVDNSDFSCWLHIKVYKNVIFEQNAPLLLYTLSLNTIVAAAV